MTITLTESTPLETKPSSCLYRGRTLESLSREELMECAAAGWKAYSDHLESSMQAVRTLNALHKAAR